MTRQLTWCTMCGELHPYSTIYWHIAERRRMTRAEVDQIGLAGFGTIYQFTDYCPKLKRYSARDGFLGNEPKGMPGIRI